MPHVVIPQTSVRAPFTDTVTIGAGDGQPAITLIVKCYPAITHWWMAIYAGDGRLLVPGKLLCTTPNALAAHQAALRSAFGRAVVCAITGESDARKPLWGQCTIQLDALSPTGALPSGLV